MTKSKRDEMAESWATSPEGSDATWCCNCLKDSIAAFKFGYDAGRDVTIEEVLKLVDIYAANSGKVRLTAKIKSLKEKV